MKRTWTLVGTAAIALVANVSVASAAAAKRPAHIDAGATRRSGDVTALSVVPGSGKAELVIAVDRSVDLVDFSLGSPPRVVLDLRGAKLGLPARLYDKIARGGITNVRIAQFKDDVVRVVVDLDSQHTYKISRDASEIRVSIDAPAGTFAAWRANGDLTTVTSAGSSAMEGQPRSSARVIARTPRTPSAQRAALSEPKLAAQPRITVTYQDADIRDVIAAFAVFSGRTIVVGKGVTGVVSAEVRDQPWDIALRAILQAQGLAAREEDSGIITVDSYDNIAQQQAAEPLTTQIIAINYTRAASLVGTVKSLLSKDCGSRGPSAGGGSGGASGCVTRGDVVVDTSTNRLIVTDAPSRLQDIANYVKDLDLRTPMVAIKAKIIVISRTNIEELGLAYDLGSPNQFFNKLIQRPDPTSFKPIDTNGDGIPDALGGGTPLDKNSDVVNLGGNSISAIANANQRVVGPALSLIFATALGKFDLTTFVDALQEVRLADIQAEPSITTLDNKEAEILSGEETPIRIIDLGSQNQGGQQNQAPRATVQFKKTGINLRVTPHVTNNRQILMTIHAERSNLQIAPSDLGYTFQTQTADNQILVGDGETAVIGGLTVTQVTQSKAGIPFLVDLPLIGRLFGDTKTQEDKNDLLILITPHIVDEGEKLGPPSGR